MGVFHKDEFSKKPPSRDEIMSMVKSELDKAYEEALGSHIEKQMCVYFRVQEIAKQIELMGVSVTVVHDSILIE